jgi:uncharacterized protein involved in exopolysaccharide biosynthesis
MTDVTIEILQNIRADIREVRDSLRGEIREVRDTLTARMDALETRQSALEYQMRGMAADVQQIPEMARLLRQVADMVADHEDRITRLES